MHICKLHINYYYAWWLLLSILSTVVLTSIREEPTVWDLVYPAVGDIREEVLRLYHFIKKELPIREEDVHSSRGKSPSSHQCASASQYTSVYVISHTAPSAWWEKEQLWEDVRVKLKYNYIFLKTSRGCNMLSSLTANYVFQNHSLGLVTRDNISIKKLLSRF